MSHKAGKEQIQVGANLQAVIKDMEKQMREAATNLEFEMTARLRDEISGYAKRSWTCWRGLGVAMSQNEQKILGSSIRDLPVRSEFQR